MRPARLHLVTGVAERLERSVVRLDDQSHVPLLRDGFVGRRQVNLRPDAAGFPLQPHRSPRDPGRYRHRRKAHEPIELNALIERGGRNWPGYVMNHRRGFTQNARNTSIWPSGGGGATERMARAAGFRERNRPLAVLASVIPTTSKEGASDEV